MNTRRKIIISGLILFVAVGILAVNVGYARKFYGNIDVISGYLTADTATINDTATASVFKADTAVEFSDGTRQTSAPTETDTDPLRAIKVESDTSSILSNDQSDTFHFSTNSSNKLTLTGDSGTNEHVFFRANNNGNNSGSPNISIGKLGASSYFVLKASSGGILEIQTENGQPAFETRKNVPSPNGQAYFRVEGDGKSAISSGNGQDIEFKSDSSVDFGGNSAYDLESVSFRDQNNDPHTPVLKEDASGSFVIEHNQTSLKADTEGNVSVPTNGSSSDASFQVGDGTAGFFKGDGTNGCDDGEICAVDDSGNTTQVTP